VGGLSQSDLDATDLVSAGLRARLNADSLVTGQLLVEFDFHPDKPAEFRGDRPPHPEIPTIPSNIQQVLADMQEFIASVQENLDGEQLLKDIQTAVSAITEIAQSPDIRETLAGINELVNSGDIRESLAGANRLINNDDTQRLPQSLRATLSEARNTLLDATKLIQSADAQLGPLVDDLEPILSGLDDTLEAGEEALDVAANQIREDAELSYELKTTLTETKRAARSLRVFLDYIERNPEALVRGKRRP
jgi:paraquat-inducible protein B